MTAARRGGAFDGGTPLRPLPCRLHLGGALRRLYRDRRSPPLSRGLPPGPVPPGQGPSPLRRVPRLPLHAVGAPFQRPRTRRHPARRSHRAGPGLGRRKGGEKSGGNLQLRRLCRGTFGGGVCPGRQQRRGHPYPGALGLAGTAALRHPGALAHRRPRDRSLGVADAGADRARRHRLRQGVFQKERLHHPGLVPLFPRRPPTGADPFRGLRGGTGQPGGQAGLRGAAGSRQPPRPRAQAPGRPLFPGKGPL